MECDLNIATMKINMGTGMKKKVDFSSSHKKKSLEKVRRKVPKLFVCLTLCTQILSEFPPTD